MLLINCPFCGERPELEFRYGGEAHIARPFDPSALDDEAWGQFLYARTNPRGLHAERWRHVHGCGRFFNALRDTTTTASPRPTRSARNARDAAEPEEARQADAGRMSAPFRLEPAGASIAASCAFRFDGKPLRASPAIRSPRRCSPTACISSGVPSNITGRAASCRRGRTSRTRSSASARSRASRPICAPPRSSSSTGSWRRARTAGHRSSATSARSTTCSRRSSRPASTTRPSCGRNRPGSTSTSRRSAPWPGSASRRHSPDPDRYAQRYAHCDVLVVGAGPAGLAAALAAEADGARVILCDEQAELGGSLLAETTARSTARSASHWLADAVATLAQSANVHASCRARRRSAISRTTCSGLAERVTDHLARPGARRQPRERLWQVRAKEVVLATGAHRAPARLSRQ